jgi:flavin-dependent dehydrogenase
VLDALVVGGGPAGLAVAGALRQRGRSVALFERSAYDTLRVGETLGAEAFPPLRAIGAWDRVGPILERQVPLRSVLSAWGSGDLAERHSIEHPLGEGRHVERRVFDAALASWAEEIGVRVLRGSGACAVTRVEGGFSVRPARGEVLTGRAFVDASGRGAPGGARLGGRRWLALDRQIAIVARMRGGSERGFDLLLEAVEDGYWYSAPQANGVLVVAHVTDADLARGTRGFEAALARAPHTARRCEGRSLDGGPRSVRADSGRLFPDHGDRWWAVGDAAFASDPLAGNGVSRALRSAADLAERIDASLDAPPDVRPDPGSPLDARFVDYLDRRASYYALEARWPDAPFWARRRAVDWRGAEMTLPPTAVLTRGTALDLSPAEALLPPRAIAAALKYVRSPTPAHAVLAEIRKVAPLGDKRLLVGLQVLVALGALYGA